MSEQRGRGRSAVARLREIFPALMLDLAQIASIAIIFPIATRSLGPDEYGRFTTLYVISGFASTWIASGVSGAIVQLLLQHSRSLRSVISIGRFQVVLSAVPIAGLAMIGSVMLFGNSIFAAALLVVVGELIIGSIGNVYLSALFAIRGVASAARVRLLALVVRVSGVVYLAWAGQLSLVSIVLMGSLGTLISAIVAGLLTRSLHRYDDRQAQVETNSREMLRYSVTYAGTISANATQNEGEKIILATYRPAAELGEYQAAYRFVGLALVPLQAVQTVATRWVLIPNSTANVHVRRAVRLSIPIAAYGVLCGCALLVGRPVIEWVLGDDFKIAADIVIWLCGFPIVRALADVPVLGLLGMDRNRERMLLGIWGAGFSLICYFSLIPGLGWRGAVIGTYVSEMATLVGGWVLLVRYQRHADRVELDHAVSQTDHH